MLEEIYSTEIPEHFNATIPDPRLYQQLPSLEEVLQDQSRSLPQRSLLLGLCEDGLPLVLDLTDPESGAFLIAGDSGFDNSALLHSILTAAHKGNREKDVSLHLISPHADYLLNFHRMPNFKISYEPHRAEIRIVLEELVNLVVKRQHDHKDSHLPAHIFAIDGLDLLYQSLDPQSKLHLDWLIQQGPAAGVWVFATIEATYLADQVIPTLDLFPSRILGRINQPNLARHLSGLSRSYLTDLYPGLEYFVRTNGQSFNIWILQSENLGV
jgi:hypothetical protein